MLAIVTHGTESCLVAIHALHQNAQARDQTYTVCAEGMTILLVTDGRPIYAQLENLLFSDRLCHVADVAQKT